MTDDLRNRVNPCTDGCNATLTNNLDIMNLEYPESSAQTFCKCNVTLYTNATIKFYDAGFIGSVNTKYPLSITIRPLGHKVHVNKSHFKQSEYIIQELEKNSSRTIALEILPYPFDRVIKRMWFWIHLEGK